MDVTRLVLRDLAELEPAENKTDVTLCWQEGPYMKEVLPVLKRWRNLTRLTLMDRVRRETSFPPLEVLSDFILGMNQLSYLHIIPDYHYSDFEKLRILRDKINEMILPRRPNFKFDDSDDFKLKIDFWRE
jgi:hypothetical protein